MTFLDKLLNYYHISLEEYEKNNVPVSSIKLIDPKSIEVMDKMTARIFKAIENKEKIIIYGDYDVDGISATSIMVKTFKKLNYEVSYYIPSRYLDGYGLNVANVEKIASKGFNMIICVDNGVCAIEAIDRAYELGMEVLVVDHHEQPNPELCHAYAILHPTISHVSDIVASAGYMSLFLSAGLLGYFDEYLTSIAGLSVISDLMELEGYNKDVVKIAIDNINKYQYPQFKLLTDSLPITEKTFAMEIAPKLNSVARIEKDTVVNRLVKYFVSEDKYEVYSLANWISEENNKRKELTTEALSFLDDLEVSEPAVVIKLDVIEGLIGLIASRLVNQLNKPAFVFTKAEDGVLKGSCRSKDGFNIVEALDLSSDFLLTHGGHSKAGGVSLKEEDFEKFKVNIYKYALSHPFIEEEKHPIEISLGDISTENYRILRTFSPFGMGNPEPEFVIKNIASKNLTYISFGKHISVKLTMNTKLLGFNMPEVEVCQHPFIDLYGSLVETSFKGYNTIEFRINSYKDSNI